MKMKHYEDRKQILVYFVELIDKLPQWQIFVITFLTIAVIIACTFDPQFARAYLIPYLVAVLFITLHYYVAGRHLKNKQ